MRLLVRHRSAFAFRNPLVGVSVSSFNIMSTSLIILAAAAFILRFGASLPYVDEWDLSLVIHQKWSISQWTFTRLNEHFFIPGNALWWLVMTATDLNFKAGMLVNLALYSLASVLLMIAAKRIRGHASVADLFIPACLLHFGHAYNLLMSYQIVFGCFLVGIAILAFAVATAEPGRESRTAKRAACSMMFLMLNGGMGLAFVPPVGLWIAFMAWRGRSISPFVALVISAAYTAFALFCAPATSAAPKSPLPVSQLVWCFVQYLGIGTGLWYDGPHWPRNGVIIASLYLAAFLHLLRKAIIIRDGGRSAGLLAMLAGHFAVGLGIAHSRGGCIAERYVTLGAAGLVIIYLSIVDIVNAKRCIVICTMTVMIYCANMHEGNQFGRHHRNLYSTLNTDAARGLSTDEIAAKHAKALRVGDNLIPALERFRDRGKFP